MKKILLMLMILCLTTVCYADQKNPCNHQCAGQEIGVISYSQAGGAFDYESQQGYREYFVAPRGIIFKICDCDEAADIVAGELYSLNIRILTDGVYWDNFNPSVAATEVSVAITSYQTEEAMCGNTEYSTAVVPVSYFWDAEGSAINDYDPDKDRSQLLSTERAHMFFVGKPYLLVDVPRMKFDPSVPIGTKVVVQLEIKDLRDICPTCVGFCYGKAVVGEINYGLDTTTFNLPYLMSNCKGWWTGIVFSNTAPVENNVKVIFHCAGKDVTVDMVLKPYEVVSKPIEQLIDYTGVLNATLFATTSCESVVLIGDGMQCYGYVLK